MDLVDPATVDAELAGGAWHREGSEIVTTRRGRDFADSLAFVNEVGALAEAMDHHPDVDIRFSAVTLRLCTHSAGGLTRLDLELARRIDALSGDTASGDTASGDAPSGDAPSGDAPSGDAPSGDAPSGDAPSGDAPSGDA